MKLTHVDLVFCHRPDKVTPIEETVRAMNHVIDRGLAFYWGHRSGALRSSVRAQEDGGGAQELSKGSGGRGRVCAARSKVEQRDEEGEASLPRSSYPERPLASLVRSGGVDSRRPARPDRPPDGAAPVCGHSLLAPPPPFYLSPPRVSPACPALPPRTKCTPTATPVPPDHLYERDKVERDFLPLYKDHGLGLTTWSPLASGVLTGKVGGGGGRAAPGLTPAQNLRL
jgi:hypothetical protein